MELGGALAGVDEAHAVARLQECRWVAVQIPHSQGRLAQDLPAARFRFNLPIRHETLHLSRSATPQATASCGGAGRPKAIVAIIDKLIKQRKDSISAFESAGRQDLADIEKTEMAVLQVYLPQRMSAEEVTAAVAAIVAELGASGPGDMGKVMGAVKAQLAGKADMGQASAAVKAALNP